MLGPAILVRTLSNPVPIGKFGAKWQYHSRSDRHSKVACWGILFDLMRHSPLLVKQLAEGKVGFGINHEMKDFRLNRKKDLDLVLCTPRAGDPAHKKPLTFKRMVKKYGILLSLEESKLLEALPDAVAAPVGAVHVALEAKAAMTEHVKAKPRIYDEFNSSHLTVHGAADLAIAVGLAMINMAKTFKSFGLSEVSHHKQPQAAQEVIAKVSQLPRRTNVREDGFDAFAIVVVECVNDGKTPVTLVTAPPAPAPGDIYEYGSMIQRLAMLYEARFPRV
jgi:hypothetical protein